MVKRRIGLEASSVDLNFSLQTHQTIFSPDGSHAIVRISSLNLSGNAYRPLIAVWASNFKICNSFLVRLAAVVATPSANSLPDGLKASDLMWPSLKTTVDFLWWLVDGGPHSTKSQSNDAAILPFFDQSMILYSTERNNGYHMNAICDRSPESGWMKETYRWTHRNGANRGSNHWLPVVLAAACMANPNLAHFCSASPTFGFGDCCWASDGISRVWWDLWMSTPHRATQDWNCSWCSRANCAAANSHQFLSENERRTQH